MHVHQPITAIIILLLLEISILFLVGTVNNNNDHNSRLRHSPPLLLSYDRVSNDVPLTIRLEYHTMLCFTFSGVMIFVFASLLSYGTLISPQSPDMDSMGSRVSTELLGIIYSCRRISK